MSIGGISCQNLKEQGKRLCDEVGKTSAMPWAAAVADWRARRCVRMRDVEPAWRILVIRRSTRLCRFSWTVWRAEADLHPLGRFLMRTHLRDILETRLRLTAGVEWATGNTGCLAHRTTRFHHRHAPERFHFPSRIAGGRSQQPRSPRMGGDVPGSRAGGGATPRDPRIRKAAACLWWFRRIVPQADAVYPDARRTPHECVAIHSFTLLSEEFVSTCRIPTYETFLRSSGLDSAYAWQKRFLQHLQSRCPTKRWVLKSPDHAFGLEELFSSFPTRSSSRPIAIPWRC